MLAIDGTKISLTSIFLDFSNQNISNISNLYNPNENLSLASQTKCDNMFSDQIFGSYIFTFVSHCYIPGLCFVSYLVW